VALIATRVVSTPGFQQAIGRFDARSGGGGFPGQPGNPVGFAVARGFPGVLTPSAWPPGGALVSGTTYSFLGFDDTGSGSGGFATTKFISTTGLAGGSAVNNVSFVGCRFGCSNPLNNTAIDCITQGSNNITFSYCSFTPSPTRWGSPPARAWPSGTAGQGIGFLPSVHPAYMVPYQDGPEFHLQIVPPTGGLCTLDHCDFWGSGDQINPNSGISLNPFGQVNITDCWIHDNREGTGPAWTSGLSYNVGDCVFATDTQEWYCIQANTAGAGNNPTGGGSPTFWVNAGSSTDHSNGIIPGAEPGTCNNLLVNHCTIASIGNTNCLAFQSRQANKIYSASVNYGVGAFAVPSDNNLYQALVNNGPGFGGAVNPIGNPGTWQLKATCFYDHVTVTNNYLSGYGNVVDAFGNDPGNNHLIFTDNIIATDLSFGQLLHADYTAQFTGSTNVWRRNRLRVYPGDTWTDANNALGAGQKPASAFDGKYIWPDASLNGADFAG
jgi:hypothetical protein